MLILIDRQELPSRVGRGRALECLTVRARCWLLRDRIYPPERVLFPKASIRHPAMIKTACRRTDCWASARPGFGGRAGFGLETMSASDRGPLRVRATVLCHAGNWSKALPGPHVPLRLFSGAANCEVGTCPMR